MKKRLLIIGGILVFLLGGAFIWSIQLADVRPPSIKKMAASDETRMEAKGRYLLELAWKAQGMDSMLLHSTYSAEGVDDWQGILGKVGKLWPEQKAKLKFDFATGTFTSRVTFLDGPRKGETAGQQDWSYYNLVDGKAVFEAEKDTKISFGLSAFQYFFELIDRIDKAPIIYYAGERNYNGRNYDLVFATWETTEAHQKHDQYLLYLDPQTYQLKAATYTVRDNYLPGGSNLYGSILFNDYRKIQGVMIPFQQTVFLNELSEDMSQYVHELKLSSFSFDEVGQEQLYPDKDLPRLGNAKK